MMTARELTDRHRAQQQLLAQAVRNDVSKLWPILDWTRIDATYPDLATQMQVLVNRNRQTSAGLASAYLKAFSVITGIKGKPKVVLAEPVPSDQFSTSLESTSVAELKASSKRGIDPALAMLNSLTMTQGSMSRLVLGGGRDTITRTTIDNRIFSGWVRVGNGECDWCKRFLDGEVRTVEYDFPAHDHCRCSAEPAVA